MSNTLDGRLMLDDSNHPPRSLCRTHSRLPLSFNPTLFSLAAFFFFFPLWNFSLKASDFLHVERSAMQQLDEETSHTSSSSSFCRRKRSRHFHNATASLSPSGRHTESVLQLAVLIRASFLFPGITQQVRKDDLKRSLRNCAGKSWNVKSVAQRKHPGFRWLLEVEDWK